MGYLYTASQIDAETDITPQATSLGQPFLLLSLQAVVEPATAAAAAAAAAGHVALGAVAGCRQVYTRSLPWLPV
jgi:hypothetical protein